MRMGSRHTVDGRNPAPPGMYKQYFSVFVDMFSFPKTIHDVGICLFGDSFTVHPDHLENILGSCSSRIQESQI